MERLYNRIIQLRNTTDDTEEIDNIILTNIAYENKDGEVSKKSFEYLSLLANENFNCLNRLIKRNVSLVKPRLLDMSELADFTIYKKQNWITEFIYNDKEVIASFRRALFPLIFVKCLQPSDDLEAYSKLIDSVIDLFDELNDEFWILCGNKIITINNILKLCKKLSVKLSKSNVDFIIHEYSMLKIFGCVLDLWHNVSQELLEELQPLVAPEDSEILAAYTVLVKFFNLLVCSKSEKMDTNEIENVISIMRDNKLKLEVLENVFSMLFMRKSHLHDKLSNDDFFICGNNQIKLVLFDLVHIFGSVHEEHGETQPEEVVNLYKHLTNARWKYELLVDLGKQLKEDQIMKYMLSSPAGLIRMCLKNCHFERAYEVIKVYSTNNVSTALCFEALYHLRCHLREKSHSLRDEDFPCSPLVEEELLEKIKHIMTSRISSIEGMVISDDISSKNLFSSEDNINESSLNMIDLTLLYGSGKEDCMKAVQLVQESSFMCEAVKDNLKDLCHVYQEVGFKNYRSFADFVLSDQAFVLKEYRSEERMYDGLKTSCMEFLKELKNREFLNLKNNNFTLFRLLIRINSIITNHLDAKTHVEYLLRLFNYLKAFSKICNIGDTAKVPVRREDIHFSNLVTTNRVELLGRLLFKMSFTSNKFEQLFDVLNLDYLYHVAANLFPTINLHVDKNISKEELYPENKLFVPDEDTIRNVLNRNWLLAFLLDEMYNVIDLRKNIDSGRISIFLNYMNSPKMHYYTNCFFPNNITAVLHGDIDYSKFKKAFTSSLIKNNEKLLQVLTKLYAKESQEKPLVSMITDLLEYIPEKQLNNDEELVKMKDMMLHKLIDEDPLYFAEYVRLIESRDLRIQIILDYLSKWRSDFSLSMIRSEMSYFESTNTKKIEQLQQWYLKIELYTKLELLLSLKSWPEALESCDSDPKSVVEKIILTDQIDVLLDYIRIHHLSSEILENINEDYIIRMLHTSDSTYVYPKVKELLYLLPKDYVSVLCKNLMKKLKNLSEVQLMCDCLCEFSDEPKLKTIQLSLKMLRKLTKKEQEQFICLIEKPLCIVESLIMNTKLDKLSPVLTVLKRECERNELEMYEQRLDELLRRYAAKSLLFPRLDFPHETATVKLLQSLDSLSLETTKPKFSVPSKVPTKDEWIYDNDIVICMCCNKVAFSMFNRRHHCRRCGRMICYSCSMKMIVSPEYGNVLVRVCRDCYTQTDKSSSANSAEAETQSLRSPHQEYWVLTDDDEHNRIIREEFSFENVPSVSLCLSILKHHSLTEEYSNFLLEQCEHMLSILQSKDKVQQEIDVFLVIQMLKTLATAIKMSDKNNLCRDSKLASKILSQIEILELLADQGCISLLPVANLIMDCLSDTAVLTKLRDILMEKEQWKLALEVSTKLGLDRTFVYVTWGKTCLSAGKLAEAREKFQFCLNQKDFLELRSSADRFEVDNRPSTSSAPHRFMAASHYFERTPAKSNHLLNEIIDILETKMLDPVQVTEQSKGDVPLSILSKMENIKALASGEYFSKIESKDTASEPNFNLVFYNECLYYITSYGSAMDLLNFFMKHGEMKKVLRYIRDANLNSDCFIEAYTNCLKSGVVNLFLKAMSFVDSSLSSFKSHLICLCRYLEEEGYFYSLYQLQEYMGDYIRAAMSCIRFYEEHVSSYTDLVSRSHFLYRALSHLNYALEEDEWVELTPVKDPDHDTPKTFEEKSLFDSSLVLRYDTVEIHKHISTISLQIEVAKYLSECEKLGYEIRKILDHLRPLPEKKKKADIPTLFGTVDQKAVVAALVIVCSNVVGDGFEISKRIVHNFKIKPHIVLKRTSQYFTEIHKLDKIVDLVKCIQLKPDVFTLEECDKMLFSVVKILVNSRELNTTESNKEEVIKYIVDKEIKVSAYIEAKQLKSAYFLAAKYKRYNDLRRILQAAEALNQPHIIAMCQRILETGSTSTYI